MAYSAVPLVATGDLWTAANHNTYLRDNMSYFKGVTDAHAVHTIGVPVTSPAALVVTGDGKAYFPIPTVFDGMNLTDAQASVSTQSTAGLPTIQVYNLTDAVDMLSTRITIGANEYTSYTALTPSVIDAAHDDVVEGDMIRIDVDVAGTATKGLTVLLTFE